MNITFLNMVSLLEIMSMLDILIIVIGLLIFNNTQINSLLGVILLHAWHFLLTQDSATKEKALHTMSSMSSAQIVSATAIHNKPLGLPPPAVSYPSPFWQGGPQASTSME